MNDFPKIFRILENPESNKFPPSFVGEILENDSILLEKLSQVMMILIRSRLIL
jgi:hypothetical protein